MSEQQGEQKFTIPSWISIDQPSNEPRIIETAFAKYMAEKTGWKCAGRIIRTAEGQIVPTSEAKRAISDEIANWFKFDTQRKIKPLFEQLLLYLPKAEAEYTLEVKTARQLLSEEIEEPTFIVNSLLPAGLTVFAAAPKTGKSWMCLALADAVATGSKFMGFDVHQGSCLYAALEDGECRVKRRLRAIGAAPTDYLQIVTNRVRRLDEGLLIQLETRISRTPDMRLIIIDTLARVKPTSAAGLDAYQADTLAIAPLQALALSRGIAIILVTHYSKASRFAADADPFDRITGSNGLFGVADSAWLIYGARGEAEKSFRVTGRDISDNEYRIAYNPESHRWTLLGTSEEMELQSRIDAYKQDPLVRTIKAVVTERGKWEVSPSELSEEVQRQTGQFPGTTKEIHTKLQDVREFLLKDDIMWSKQPGGRKGRNYIFEPPVTVVFHTEQTELNRNTPEQQRNT